MEALDIIYRNGFQAFFFLISKIKKIYQNENLCEIPIVKQPKEKNQFLRPFKPLLRFGKHFIIYGYPSSSSIEVWDP